METATTVLDFLKTYWFIGVGVLWFILALTNQKYRDKIIEMVFSTIEKKVVQVDLSGHSFTLYTKGDLEKIGPVVVEKVVNPVSGLVKKCQGWSRPQWQKMNNEPEKHVRKLWYIFALLLFLAFVWSDGVTIYNSLSVSALKASVPDVLIPWLSPYDIAVAFGSLICLVVVFLIFVDLVAHAGITDWVEAKGGLRVFGIFITFLLAVSSITVMLAMAGIRFGVLEQLTPDKNSGNIYLFNLAMSYLVPANVVITTVLITHDAYKGFWMVILILLEAVFSLLYVVHYLLNIVAALGNVGVEMVIFLIFILLLVLLFVVTSPFLMLWGVIPQRGGPTPA